MRCIEEIRISRESVLKWFYDDGQYRVNVKTYNRDIYNKLLDYKHYKIYHNYINERVKYLVGEKILDREYTMILLDNTMYKVLDHFHFMELMRFIMPVDSLEESNVHENLFDLVLDATIRTGEIFEQTDLVYHNGIFYNDGNRVKDIWDFKRDGIEFDNWDLMNGLTKEQLDYLVWDYYSPDFKRYITKEVNLNIDRWY